MPTIACPSCGSSEDLAGSPAGDAVMVRCGRCGYAWERDTTPTCRLCGSNDLVAVPTSTLEEAGRGDQRTPSGIRDVYHCTDCGARDATSSAAARPEQPARGRPATPRLRARTEASDDTAERPGRIDRIDGAFGTFEVGAVVGGRWRLARLVQRSSSGTIWEAVAVDAARRVAFKLVDPARTVDEEAASLHAASARAVAEARHPNLLTVHDVLRRGPGVLIVAEHAAGATLDQHDLLPVDRLLDVAAECAGALAALHDAGLPHLDVRPSKILLTEDGGSRLVDLGSGRVRAKHPAGTPPDRRLAWQAPEQIVGRRHRPAADVHSLGLVLWAAAGGQLEDLGPNPAAQAEYRLRHPLPPLRDVPPRLPRAFVTAVEAAGQPRPQDRPTARELAALLETARTSAPRG